PPPTPGVLGVFQYLDATLDAIKKLRAAGHTDFTVYSPVPRHEIEDALGQPVSPVRMFTLIGGIAGCAVGAWLTLWMSYVWEHVESSLRITRSHIASIAALAFNPDDIVHKVGLISTMRHQRNIKPYARPIPPVAGAVPVSGAELPLTRETADRLTNPRTRTAESLNRGQWVFQTYCLVCHGERGDGNGPVSLAGGGPFPGVPSLVDPTRPKMTDGMIYG